MCSPEKTPPVEMDESPSASVWRRRAERNEKDMNLWHTEAERAREHEAAAHRTMIVVVSVSAAIVLAETVLFLVMA